MKNVSDYESINSVNRLNFIIGEVDGYIEGSSGNKYLISASPDKKHRNIDKIQRNLEWD